MNRQTYIRFFKASVNDKGATVKVSELRKSFKFKKLKAGDTLTIVVGDKTLAFRASRNDAAKKDCKTLYSVEPWPADMKPISIGEAGNAFIKGKVR
jgi:hypothetical protein